MIEDTSMINTKLDPFAKLEQAKDGSNAPMKAEKAKILCVDDEERILNSLRAIFRFKYDVYLATSGAEALDILREHNIAVVISDQRMPNMTGIDFLRQAKEVSPATVRVLLTGFSDLQAVIDSVNDGEVFRFLNKPWGNKEIQAIVEEAVAVYQDTKDTLLAVTPPPPVETAAGAQKSVILIKAGDRTLFEDLQAAALPSMELVRVSNRQEALDALQKLPVSVLVTRLDEPGDNEDEEIDFLRLLKRELPGLMTVGIVESADYDEILYLINEAKVYRYAVLPTKASRIVFFIESALQRVRLMEANPVLLRQQSVEQSRPLQETAEPMVKKVGLIRKMFGRRWGQSD